MEPQKASDPRLGPIHSLDETAPQVVRLAQSVGTRRLAKLSTRFLEQVLPEPKQVGLLVQDVVHPSLARGACDGAEIELASHEQCVEEPNHWANYRARATTGYRGV